MWSESSIVENYDKWGKLKYQNNRVNLKFPFCFLVEFVMTTFI